VFATQIAKPYFIIPWHANSAPSKKHNISVAYNCRASFS
jgi:hypothetical protein